MQQATVASAIDPTVTTSSSTSPPVSPSAASWRTSSSEDVTSPVVFEDFESEIDEEYWRKYPDLRPGSMARELTRAEADILHAELTEAVSTFGFKDLPTWSCPSNIHGVCGHPLQQSQSKLENQA